MMNKYKSISAVFGFALLLTSCSFNNNGREWNDVQAMLKALEWQEKNPIYSSAPTDWTNGAYYTGVCMAHRATDEDAFFEALIDMSNRNQWQPSDRFYHADDLTICTSYLYLKLLDVKEADLSPTEKIIQEHLEKPHEWKNGDSNSNQPILWWWCDALFMSPPLITLYADYKNDYSYLDKMHQYYLETYDLLFDKEEKLFARDVRYVGDNDSNDLREKNGEKIFWSRGNGWVMGGLALILENMPSSYENRSFYLDLYKEMSKRILEIQHEDGLWRPSLLSPESYQHGEVSGSGFYTFALAWGINNGILDKNTYKPAVEKAWTALRACQRKDGMVGWVQNIGDSPKPVSAESWQNYGTGAFLLAGSEMIKLLSEED